MSPLTPVTGWKADRWTPADISPYAWYDAVLSPKLIETGNLVSSWEDISGTGIHVTQVTESYRPSYSEADKWIDFDGSNDRLEPSSEFLPSGNTPFTLFAIPRWDVTTIDKYFFGQGSGANNRSAFTGTMYNIAGRPAFSWYGSNLNGGSFSINTDYVMSYRYTSGSRQFWQNGTSVTSDSYSSSNLTTNTPAIGALLVNSAYFDGKLRTLILFRSALSTDNRQKVEGYLAHRWGLAGNLPEDHPYKSAPPKA